MKLDWRRIEMTIYLLTMAIFVATFFTMWLYPWKAIEVYTQPYVVNEEVITPASLVSYYIEYCRYTDVDSQVIHQIENREGLKFRITDNYAVANNDGLRLREGCGSVTKSVFIPPYVEPGEYRIVEDISYKVNPLHTSSYTFYTNWFTIE